ncbi:MAG TPA: hypothetical protein PKM63_22050 [Panacibacter sp.]|nr:hypothetical protein [Panacibacter sp.]HNP46997.1 hypothetical protein [Panacibacter sp.]
MRIISFLFLLTISLSSNGQTNNPFLSLKFDKVVFFDFEDIGEKGSLIVDNNGKYFQTVIKQVQLDTQTIKELNAKLGDKKSYGNGAAACFDPHCGFVYFLKGKPVGQITICLSCNRLYSSIDIPAQKQGQQGQGKDAYYILDGLSKSFRQFINGLIKENKFTHQIEPGLHFDE